MSKRTVITLIEVDDDTAIQQDLGTIAYLEREFGWLGDSAIYLREARILDKDDPYDAQAVDMANMIFES